MSSEPWVRSPRLAVHVQWILDQVRPKAAALKELLQPGVSADVFCYSVGRTEAHPPLPRALRGQLRELGLRVDIDHYQV